MTTFIVQSIQLAGHLTFLRFFTFLCFSALPGFFLSPTLLSFLNTSWSRKIKTRKRMIITTATLSFAFELFINFFCSYLMPAIPNWMYLTTSITIDEGLSSLKSLIIWSIYIFYAISWTDILWSDELLLTKTGSESGNSSSSILDWPYYILLWGRVSSVTFTILRFYLEVLLEELFSFLN